MQTTDGSSAPAAPKHARLRRHVVAALASVTALCAGLVGAQASGLLPRRASATPPSPAAPPTPMPSPAGENADVCLARTLCALKEQIRWRKAPWSNATCMMVAKAVREAAEEHQLSPALIVAVMLNESDLDERALALYRRNGRVFAQDAGLMGIRCELDRHGRCKNGFVRGLAPRTTAELATNIALGARHLAYDRDRGGVERRMRARAAPDGTRVLVEQRTRCRHRGHAYWAHYNHGSYYLTRGPARHYPHRVAVLYYALARTLGLPTDEVTGRQLTVHDPGRRMRTAERPVEPRLRTLVDKIYAAGSCRSDSVLASLTAGR